jgi:excisionase family DNA binding protein
MATRAKRALPDIDVTSQLGLFEVLEARSVRPRGERAPALLEEARSRRPPRGARPVLPRLCVKPEEAAKMLSVSRDYFDEHVKPELRIVRHGSRTVLIPVAELVRWVERNAAR